MPGRNHRSPTEGARSSTRRRRSRRSARQPINESLEIFGEALDLDDTEPFDAPANSNGSEFNGNGSRRSRSSTNNASRNGRDANHGTNRRDNGPRDSQEESTMTNEGRGRRRRRRRGRRPADGGQSDARQRGRNSGGQSGQTSHNQQNGNSSSNSSGSNPRGRRRRSRAGQRRDSARPRTQSAAESPKETTAVVDKVVEGVLELHPKGYGFLRDPANNYLVQETDPFVANSMIDRFQLRPGISIRGPIGRSHRGQGPRLLEIDAIDSRPIESYQRLKDFDSLTAVTPHSQIRLETGPRPITTRVMDLLTPVGKGQRALIVAPPRTGKTMLLQDIADAVSANHPEIQLKVLLIDERPEEVTEMRRRVRGEVIASSMDREVESHVRLSKLMLERAKRLAEMGEDVLILIDSITRLARAFNKWGGDSGRTMSGGLDVKALDLPKKIFGSARQFEEGGSLTIIATALIETGSRMDEVIFQEFKGTGNMELVLSRDLADRRIWPAIDITRSGTRHEEKLLGPEAMDSVVLLRRSLISLSPAEAMEQLVRTLERFPTNREFLDKVKAIL